MEGEELREEETGKTGYFLGVEKRKEKVWGGSSGGGKAADELHIPHYNYVYFKTSLHPQSEFEFRQRTQSAVFRSTYWTLHQHMLVCWAQFGFDLPKTWKMESSGRLLQRQPCVFY